jgi:hypothetical protein
MMDLVRLIVWTVVDLLRSRAALEAEVLTLRWPHSIKQLWTTSPSVWKRKSRRVGAFLRRTFGKAESAKADLCKSPIRGMMDMERPLLAQSSAAYRQ